MYFIVEFMQILAVFLSTFSHVTTSEINDFWTYQWDESIDPLGPGEYCMLCAQVVANAREDRIAVKIQT